MNTEGPALEIRFRAGIKGLYELVEEGGETASFSLPHRNGLLPPVVRVADAVEAGHGRDHYDVPASAHQGSGGTQTQFFYLVIDTQVLFYIGVGGGDVGLRLIIIIVGNEIFHRIVREERLEFAVKLCRQRLVVAQDESGTLQVLNYIRHGEGLSGTGNAQQRHVVNPVLQGFSELADRLRLVSRRLILRIEMEFHCRGKDNKYCRLQF